MDYQDFSSTEQPDEITGRSVPSDRTKHPQLYGELSTYHQRPLCDTQMVRWQNEGLLKGLL
jgi:hypothetical protein